MSAQCARPAVRPASHPSPGSLANIATLRLPPAAIHVARPGLERGPPLGPTPVVPWTGTPLSPRRKAVPTACSTKLAPPSSAPPLSPLSSVSFFLRKKGSATVLPAGPRARERAGRPAWRSRDSTPGQRTICSACCRRQQLARLYRPTRRVSRPACARRTRRASGKRRSSSSVQPRLELTSSPIPRPSSHTADSSRATGHSMRFARCRR